MPPVNGTTVLLSVRTSSGPDVYTAVGSQTGLSISESNDEIDYSSKDAREFTGAAGRYKSTVSLDALYIPANAGLVALKTATRAGTNVRIRRSAVGAEAIEQADGFVTSFDAEYPMEAPCTLSVGVTINGAWGASS